MAAILESAGPPSPPVRASTLDPPRPRCVELVVVSGDDALLEQVGRALDGDSTVRQADSPDEARACLRPATPCVLLVDTRGHDDVARLVADLQAPDGSSVLIAFAPAEACAEVARAVRGSAAFAVLPIPPEPGQTAAVIEGASEEARARCALLAGADPVATPAADPLPEPATPTVVAPATRARGPTPLVRTRRAGPRPRWPVFAAAAFALLVAAAGWVWLNGDGVPDGGPASPAAAVPPPVAGADPLPAAVPATALAGTVDDLLDQARTAMRERRYTDPAGDNALDRYRAVLRQDPGNGEAREGLQRIATVLGERVEAALDAQRTDEAARTLGLLSSLGAAPEVAGYASRLLQLQLRDALDDGDVERARALVARAARDPSVAREDLARWQGEIERHQGAAQAERLGELVQLRIRQGRLTEPAGDSARHHLAQLRRLPAVPREFAQTATVALQQAYLDRMRDALGRGQRGEADRWKAEARALGVGAAELAAVQREATARAAAAESRAEPARTAGNTRTAGPDAAATEAGRDRPLDGAETAAQAAPALPAPKLTQTRHVAPAYPADALKRGVAGDVRLRLVVDARGRVVDAAVVRADPPRVFDAAATAAARRWRYAPIGPKGSDVTVTAHVDVAFRPEDVKR